MPPVTFNSAPVNVLPKLVVPLTVKLSKWALFCWSKTSCKFVCGLSSLVAPISVGGTYNSCAIKKLMLELSYPKTPDEISIPSPPPPILYFR